MAKPSGATFAVVTNFDEHYEVGYLCAAVNEAYCKRWDHRFIPCVLTHEDMVRVCAGRHFAWAKVALFRWFFSPERLDATSAGVFAAWLGGDNARQELLRSVEYLVWVDGDAMIVQHDLPLAEYVKGAVRSKALVLSEDMSWADWVNTGVFFVRTDSDWARTLWSEAWEMSSPRFHQAPFWDQSALCQTLAQRCEFTPDVLGARPTGKPPSESPWYSWQGGRVFKETRHLYIFDASSLQFANPGHVHFVFHACGFKCKLKLCRDVLQLGLLRGLCKDDLAMREYDAKATFRASPLWQEACRTVSACLDRSLLFSWGWPKTECLDFEACEITKLSTREVALQWASTENEFPFLIQITPPKNWSLANLRDSFGEVSILVDDCAPLRPDDRLRKGKIMGPTARVRLWQLCDYVRGMAPPVHPVLGHLDPERQWRTTRWTPWDVSDHGSSQVAGQKPNNRSLPYPWKHTSGCEIEDLFAPLWTEANMSSMRISDELADTSAVHVTPPGAKTRLHCPSMGRCTHFIIWQLEGQLDVAMFPPNCSNVLSKRGSCPLFDAAQSAVDPWCEKMKLDSCKPLFCRARPGDSLLLPVGWWISTATRSPSLSVWRPWVSQARVAEFESLRRRAFESSAEFRLPNLEKAAAFAPLAARIRAPGGPSWCKEHLSFGSDVNRVDDAKHQHLESFQAVVHIASFLPNGQGVQSSRQGPAPVPLALLVGSKARGSEGLASALRAMQIGEIVCFASLDSAGCLTLLEIELVAVLEPLVEMLTRKTRLPGGWYWFGDPANWLGAPVGHEPEDQVAKAARNAGGGHVQIGCANCRDVSSKTNETSLAAQAKSRSSSVFHLAACTCYQKKWAMRCKVRAEKRSYQACNMCG